MVIEIQWGVRMYWKYIYIGNNIGTKGATKIGESLKINTSLTELDLRGNWNSTICCI